MGEKIAAPIALGVRLVLGAVFVYAGIIKALHPDAFALQVENYRILGYAPSVAVSLYLPYLEIACGLSLLSKSLYAGGLFLTGTLTLIFTAALCSAWARGLDIACGCFGSGDGRTHYGSDLLRDLAMLIALMFLYLRFYREPGTAPAHSPKR